MEKFTPYEKLSKKEKKKARKIIKTGGFVDEIYEDELQEEDDIAETTEDLQNAASEAHELLKKEIAAATADEVVALEEESELEKDIELEVLTDRAKETVVEELQEFIKIVRPMPSAAQLAEAAKKAGDSPDIVRDGITKVTLFDYSDIIGGEE